MINEGKKAYRGIYEFGSRRYQWVEDHKLDIGVTAAMVLGTVCMALA